MRRSRIIRSESAQKVFVGVFLAVFAIASAFFFAPEISDREAEQMKLFEQSLDKDRQITGVGAVSGTVPVRVAAISDEQIKEIISRKPISVRTEPITEEQIIRMLANKPESFKMRPLMKTESDISSKANP